jgi:hypothetical protein
MALPSRNGVQNTAPYVISDPTIPQPAGYAVFLQGGYHQLDYYDDGTENSLFGIKLHHRSWNMLVAIEETAKTYKLIRGHFNADILDNRNWKVWADDNAAATAAEAGGLAPWSATDAQGDPQAYPLDAYVGHQGRIWQSTLADNLLEPGTIDFNTYLPTTAWREVTLDSLSHLRNHDTQLRYLDGSGFLTALQIRDSFQTLLGKAHLRNGDTQLVLSDGTALTADQISNLLSALAQMAHARNGDTQLLRSNGSPLLADQITTIADLSRTHFVSPGGNNVTAQKGRIDRPYATISAAIAASQVNGAGEDQIETILVFPGLYTENINVAYKQFNLKFLPGARLQAGAGTVLGTSDGNSTLCRYYDLHVVFTGTSGSGFALRGQGRYYNCRFESRSPDAYVWQGVDNNNWFYDCEFVGHTKTISHTGGFREFRRCRVESLNGSALSNDSGLDHSSVLAPYEDCKFTSLLDCYLRNAGIPSYIRARNCDFTSKTGRGLVLRNGAVLDNCRVDSLGECLYEGVNHSTCVLLLRQCQFRTLAARSVDLFNFQSGTVVLMGNTFHKAYAIPNITEAFSNNISQLALW